MKNKTKLLIRDAFFSTLLSSILIFLLALIIFNTSFLNPIHKAFSDFSFLDAFYAKRFHNTSKVNTDIILINVQNKSRFEIAQILKDIIDEGPKTIGVDIIFRDKKENVYADSLLASLLKNVNIITSYDIEYNEIIYNHSYFGETEKSGFINFNFDPNTAVIREFNGETSVLGEERLSFASQIAKHYLNDKWGKFGYNSRLKRAKTIKFIGNYSTFQYLDFEDFLYQEEKIVLKDKIVILGYLGNPTGSRTDITDKFFTPLNQYFTGKTDRDMFGVAIHANIVNMLINNDFMITFSNFWLGVITFLSMFFSTVFYMKINRKHKVSYRTRKNIFQFVVSVFILGFSLWLFKYDVVLKPVVIIFGVILAGSYFKYYKHFTRYLKSKFKLKWKTYLK